MKQSVQGESMVGRKLLLLMEREAPKEVRAVGFRTKPHAKRIGRRVTVVMWVRGWRYPRALLVLERLFVQVLRLVRQQN
jgi:hypothetical protein